VESHVNGTRVRWRQWLTVWPPAIVVDEILDELPSLKAEHIDARSQLGSNLARDAAATRKDARRKLLLDAMMTKRLATVVPGHEVHHVTTLGWRDHHQRDGIIASAKKTG